LKEALEAQAWNREGLFNLRNFKCVETRMAGLGVLVEQAATFAISVDSARSKPVADVVTGVYVSRRRQAELEVDATRGAQQVRLAATTVAVAAAGLFLGLLKAAF
jgi:hypothetical protein